MGFDDELSGRLRTGVDGVQPDVSRLVAGGMERGKRFVRRRRIVQVVAAGATLAVLGGVAHAAPWNQSPELQVATTPAQPKPATKPATKPKQADITAQATLQLLLDQLPAGAKTTEYEGGEFLGRSEDGEVQGTRWTYAYLTYSDSTGATSFMSVNLDWQDQTPEMYQDMGCPEPFGAGEWYKCEYEELPDGSKLELRQDRTYPASANTEDDKAGPDGRGPKNRSVTLVRADGLMITIHESNANDRSEKLAPETRETPPLTLAQLKAIVLSDTWQTKLDPEYVKQAEKLFEPRRETQEDLGTGEKAEDRERKKTG